MSKMKCVEEDEMAKEDSMMNRYQETALIRTRDCDLNGVWRFSAILEAMQEAAGVHSASMGWGREQLIRQGAVWVLVRSEVRMERYPSVGEHVTMETFHMPDRHRLFPRYFIMTDGEGKQIGTAATVWMLMNLETRAAVSAESVGMQLPDNRDMTPPIRFPAPIQPVEGEPKISLYRAVYSDLDVNGHVNNTKDADWICNLLGKDLLTKKEISRMILDYNAEVLPDQEVTFRLTRQEDRCQLAGLCGEKKAFEIGCELRERAFSRPG